MITVLLLLVLIGSAYALFSRDLLHGTIALSMTVAITEAAVGAGLSTVIFLWVIKKNKTE